MTLPIENPPKKTMPRWAWIVLALILILAGALRFTMIGAPVYELDEYWHAELSTGRGTAQNHLPQNQLIMPGAKVTGLKDAPPIWKIWTHMEETVHPPMYPIALRLWRATFGEGAASSRSLGAMASIVSIALLFDIVRRMHGITSALWSAAIFAVASPQISLSRTLRGYAFGLMLILIVAWIVVRLVEDPPDRPARKSLLLIALCLLTAASVLTYYFAICPLTAIGLYALARLRGSLRWQAALAMAMGVGIFVITWLPSMREQSRTLPPAGDTWIGDAVNGHIVRVLVWAGSIPLRMLFEPRNEVAMFAILGAALFFVPVVLLRRQPRVLLWLFWLWMVMLPLAVLDLKRDTKHVSFVRYTLAAGPAVYALLAVTMQQARLASMRTVLPAVAFVACMLSIGSAYEDPRKRYDELADYIDSRSDGTEPIIVYSQSITWFGNAFFLTTSHESKTYPWPIALINSAPVSDALTADIRAHSRRAWLVTEGQVHPTTIIPGTRLLEWQYIPFVGLVWHLQFEN